jgi:putative transcriptional regulator
MRADHGRVHPDFGTGGRLPPFHLAPAGYTLRHEEKNILACRTSQKGGRSVSIEAMAVKNVKTRLFKSDGYLDGQLLIAMPSMTDPRFNRAVIYLCAHSAEGAMGLIINQRAPHITLSRLLEQLDITVVGSRPVAILVGSMAVHVGGPVETSRGFVLHSADYFAADSTLQINESVYLTATIDILKAIAKGSGPDKAILALGYAGWAPGQLEREIQANGWLNCPADSEIVFDANIEAKYNRALARLGINPSYLVGAAGRA